MFLLRDAVHALDILLLRSAFEVDVPFILFIEEETV